MLKPVPSSTFKTDVKRQQRRGKDMTKLTTLITLLVNEQPLPAIYEDHPLKRDWKGYRDAHMEGDWILIYKVVGNDLQLARTGTHQDIFSNY
ncbi:type II toxin-antitoxin system YafQ family toxin [Pantoea sp. paga]|uniref:type II toxin-antitoxin system YafQ family toxin n=1 Tax=Pantoea sp. paga TaxID=2597519 RepID=UPI00117D4BC9|nr:type II toxin-antitoxin system YafQ family toxin [Pantoea sp. paga]TSH77925.1 type II toxin-antitoxin system YafQ family toxin [Pantoea sp. paga]